MYGLTESLNVSVAAAVALHFGRVARSAALTKSGGSERTGRLNAEGGDLGAEEVEALLADYRSRGKQHGKTGPQKGVSDTRA